MTNELHIYQKLNLVQSELKAPKGQYNKFGNYKYRNAEGILEAVKPLNNKYGLNLTISDETQVESNGWTYVVSIGTLVNVDIPTQKIVVTGRARESQIKKGMDDSQITGATSSYARKYMLNGLYLIDDTKDADTEQYHNQQQTSSPQQTQTNRQQPIDNEQHKKKVEDFIKDSFPFFQEKHIGGTAYINGLALRMNKQSVYDASLIDVIDTAKKWKNELIEQSKELQPVGGKWYDKQ